MFDQYEDLKREIRGTRGASDRANLASLVGQM
jgi:hypothetical protein